MLDTYGTFHFLTAIAPDPQRALFTRHIGALGAAVREVRRTRRFRIAAHVVLPDHLHALCECPRGTDFHAVWGAVEAVFVRNLARERGDASAFAATRTHWDCEIADHAHAWQLIHRIHSDPVRHGLVTRPVFWPWSSFSRYVRSGVYATTWSGNALPGPRARGARAGVADATAEYVAACA